MVIETDENCQIANMKRIRRLGVASTWVVSIPAFDWIPRTTVAALLPPCPPKKFPSQYLLTSRREVLVSSLFPFFGSRSKPALKESCSDDPEQTDRIQTRIGIIGGGIAGVSAANALANRLLGKSALSYEIVVFDGDPHSPACKEIHGQDQYEKLLSSPPMWKAATAKNANSIVPGASMHVFSHKSVLWKVLQDSLYDWYTSKCDTFRSWLSGGVLDSKGHLYDFTSPPPYFAMDLWKCIGPSATQTERTTFFRYLKGYLHATLWLNEDTSHKRGEILCNLAKANRALFQKAADELNEKGYNIQYSKGFLALFRSRKSAEEAVTEVAAHGEEARILSSDEAIKMEPHMENIPVKDVIAVHRPNDIISSCDVFVRALTREIQSVGVRVHGDNQIQKIEYTRDETIAGDSLPRAEANRRFRVIKQNGDYENFDIVVLAAGIQSALFAEHMGVGAFVPTYPLRGFSLTMKVWQKGEREGNLLMQPFSLDSMYCSSVAPLTARWAGFGEFVGYPRVSDNVSSMGPKILSGYAASVFPDAVSVHSSKALSCSRPVSPDDLPIVGGVPAKPGLYVHTGHGTLGWTTSLATAECLADVVFESLEKQEATSTQCQFLLPCGVAIDRNSLSPSRFA